MSFGELPFQPGKIALYADALNLLLGERIGSGVHRDVFECRLRPDLVVKIETDIDDRSFANHREWSFWNEYREYKPVSKWLAPCFDISPDGRVMMQKRVKPVAQDDDLPAKLPKFLTDTKRGNFGWLDGRLVCVDYAATITNAPAQAVKAHWW